MHKILCLVLILSICWGDETVFEEEDLNLFCFPKHMNEGEICTSKKRIFSINSLMYDCTTMLASFIQLTTNASEAPSTANFLDDIRKKEKIKEAFSKCIEKIVFTPLESFEKENWELLQSFIQASEKLASEDSDQAQDVYENLIKLLDCIWDLSWLNGEQLNILNASWIRSKMGLADAGCSYILDSSCGVMDDEKNKYIINKITYVYAKAFTEALRCRNEASDKADRLAFDKLMGTCFLRMCILNKKLEDHDFNLECKEYLNFFLNYYNQCFTPDSFDNDQENYKIYLRPSDEALIAKLRRKT